MAESLLMWRKMAIRLAFHHRWIEFAEELRGPGYAGYARSNCTQILRNKKGDLFLADDCTEENLHGLPVPHGLKAEEIACWIEAGFPKVLI